MKAMSPEMRAQVATMLKAVAHPTRLQLLEELVRGEKCVCELVPMTKADFSTVSKHLALLRACGLVKSRKQDLNVYYSIAMEEIAQIISFSKAAVKGNYQRFLKVSGG